jgi:hypothetical protein
MHLLESNFLYMIFYAVQYAFPLKGLTRYVNVSLLRQKPFKLIFKCFKTFVGDPPSLHRSPILLFFSDVWTGRATNLDIRLFIWLNALWVPVHQSLFIKKH